MLFLYALSVQHLYTKCLQGLNVKAFGYADDLTLVGPADEVLAAFVSIINECEREDDGGLRLTLSKCAARGHVTPTPRNTTRLWSV